jgi:hypothetical protein
MESHVISAIRVILDNPGILDTEKVPSIDEILKTQKADEITGIIRSYLSMAKVSDSTRIDLINQYLHNLQQTAVNRLENQRVQLQLREEQTRPMGEKRKSKDPKRDDECRCAGIDLFKCIPHWSIWLIRDVWQLLVLAGIVWLFFNVIMRYVKIY